MGIASTMVIVYIVKGIGSTMVIVDRVKAIGYTIVIVYIVIGYSMVIVYITRERTLEGIGFSFWRLVANACTRMSSSHWPMPVPLPAAAAWQKNN